MDDSFEAIFDEYEPNNRYSASLAYQKGFSDATKESETYYLEIYVYMLCFIMLFAASHMIRVRGQINDRFV